MDTNKNGTSYKKKISCGRNALSKSLGQRCCALDHKWEFSRPHQRPFFSVLGESCVLLLVFKDFSPRRTLVIMSKKRSNTVVEEVAEDDGEMVIESEDEPFRRVQKKPKNVMLKEKAKGYNIYIFSIFSEHAGC
jgi:hypothetical protein